MTAPMLRRPLILLTGLALVALSGCSGLALLAIWDQYFNNHNESPSDYRVFLNGYDLSASATANGIFVFPGVSGGDYLLSVARASDLRTGLHATVRVQPRLTVNLSGYNPFDGGVISGTVRSGSASGPLLAGVRVVAIYHGLAALVSAAPVVIPQAFGTTMDYMMGFTNSSGQFKLGPAKFGDWIVTVAAAGYAADAKYLSVASGTDGVANLVLTSDAGASVGTIRSTISGSGGATIQLPLLTAALATPFEPTITAATRSAVAAAAHTTLPSGPWFRFLTLATVGSTSGVCLLDVPAGTHSVEGFKYGYTATQASVAVAPGDLATHDFALPGA
jgi:hypothetical protein